MAFRRVLGAVTVFRNRRPASAETSFTAAIPPEKQRQAFVAKVAAK
jgi:hypothetical protein